ncbi:MAG: HEPN domain-containing protein [Methermicoccaceae archaeon]
MRQEAEMWWKQALKDLEAAEKNMDIGIFYLVAFLCQQSVEKALKALYIEKLRRSPEMTHSLVYLGKSVGLDEKFLSNLRKMAPDFIISRYPDVSQEPPYELYDREMVEERLKHARELIEWVGNALSK